MVKYKLVEQLDDFCGPATLKIVFDYHGIVKSQQEWARLSGTTHENGVQNEGMFRAIKAVGFNYKLINEASFDDVRRLIAQKQTIIAIWWSGNWGHYSPVAAINGKTITLADPELGKLRRIELERFDHFWFDFAQDYQRKASDLQLRNLIWIYKPQK